MKIAFHNMYESLNPLLFRARNAPIGDDLLLPLMYVKEEAKRMGVTVGSTETIKEPDAVVFLDYPLPDSAGTTLLQAFEGPKYLVTFENSVIHPANFAKPADFTRVFTWNDDLVAQSDRFVKINYAQEFPRTPPPSEPRDFCCMVASNKQSSDPRLVYSLRARAINWFERYSPDDLTVYGPGWHGRAVWRGLLPPGTKRLAMRNFKYALVFENAREPGYITEKIFDALIAGCVPVYFGAPNIAQWVDPNLYFDLARYRPLITDPNFDFTMFSLVREQLTDANFFHKRRAIARWLDSGEVKPFTCETFARTLLDTVVGTP